MVMSGPGAGWDAPPPVPSRAECDRAAFTVGLHADDEIGVCLVCGVSRCRVGREAQAVVLVGVRAGVLRLDEVGDTWDGAARRLGTWRSDGRAGQARAGPVLQSGGVGLAGAKRSAEQPTARTDAVDGYRPVSGNDNYLPKSQFSPTS